MTTDRESIGARLWTGATVGTAVAIGAAGRIAAAAPPLALAAIVGAIGLAVDAAARARRLRLTVAAYLDDDNYPCSTCGARWAHCSDPAAYGGVPCCTGCAVSAGGSHDY